ncbi:hypothetical protein WMF30_22635 [Sorangium sp. So ce134]
MAPPRGGERFYVCDREGERRTVGRAPIDWLNGLDYHGVGPFFRCSIRVDGVFEPAFVKRLQRLYRR